MEASSPERGASSLRRESCGVENKKLFCCCCCGAAAAWCWCWGLRLCRAGFVFEGAKELLEGIL